MKRKRKFLKSNPVATAIARATWQRATLDQRLQLFLMQHGEPCAAEMGVMSRVIGALLAGVAAHPEYGPDSVEARKLRGAKSACRQMLSADRFDKANVVALDQALEMMLALSKRLDPDVVLAAWGGAGEP